MAVFTRLHGTHESVFCYKKRTLTLIRIKRVELTTGIPLIIRVWYACDSSLGAASFVVAIDPRFIRSLLFVCPVKFSCRFLS